jgi:hypothetical protein
MFIARVNLLKGDRHSKIKLLISLISFNSTSAFVNASTSSTIEVVSLRTLPRVRVRVRVKIKVRVRIKVGVISRCIRKTYLKTSSPFALYLACKLIWLWLSQRKSSDEESGARCSHQLGCLVRVRVMVRVSFRKMRLTSYPNLLP